MHLLRLHAKQSTTQKAIIDSVKKFCKQELVPRVRKDYRIEVIDRSIVKNMGNMGILGPTINGFNCLGESYTTYGLIAKELEAVDSGYRSMYSVQSSLVMNPIAKYANAFTKEKYLPGLASGDLIGCFGLTEPDAGSDPSAMKTTAVQDGNSFILSGTKTWISNAPIADVMIVWAKLNDRVHGFVLDRQMNGITTPKIDGKLSLRTSVTGMIQMDEVKVPLSNMLNVSGMSGPFSCLNDARLGIAFGVMGAAETCISTAINYAENRSLFGTPLSQKQLFQLKIADAVSEYNLGLLACYHVAEYVDKGEKVPEMISLVKKNSCLKALNIARVCRDILGGNGISEEYDIFRHLCNLETVYTYEGTNDIHGLILGQHITEKKAF
ncbi:MAG: acyl-CoA dehydrogenase [Candidatus Pelagibacter sp.]|nr:acyl-CoA dehydrogenase [Candidatus Pelagibacter sp.]|tara:strand:+ start:2351 stop:3493 length:1143 start_codon:yes stop_codon:yes gene_type:complete